METPDVAPDNWEEQLIHFAMGTMDPEESASFSAALEECRKRALLASSYSQVLGLMGTTAVPAEPPAGHRARLLERVAGTPQAAVPAGAATTATVVAPEPAGPATRAIREDGVPTRLAGRRSTAAWVWGAGIAAVVLVGLVGWLALTLGTVQQLRGEVNIPAGYRTVALAPTEEYTGVSAVVIFNPESTEAWLVADGLRPLPDDLIYELWLIRPANQGTSEVGGVFGPREDGTAVHRATTADRIADYAGFAVSIERKPGVTEREGPVVVVGRFEGQ